MKRNFFRILLAVVMMVVLLVVVFMVFIKKSDDLVLVESEVELFLERLIEDERLAYDGLDEEFTSRVSFEDFVADIGEFNNYEILSSRTGKEFGFADEAHVVVILDSDEEMQFLLKLGEDGWKIFGVGFEVGMEGI